VANSPRFSCKGRVGFIVWLDEWLATPLIENSANFETEPYTKSSDDSCGNRFCGAESACT